MKILIAYDGSECSDAAIVDLQRAGLPPNAQALILSVSESGPPQVVTAPLGALEAGSGTFIPLSEPVDNTDFGLENAQSFAAQAADRLRADFPEWKIKTESWDDSPASAIIRTADSWKPDLIVVGSHGRSSIGRLILGSVSQHILHHVSCSVRISRHRLLARDRPIRLLIGIDGSENSKLAAQSVASRNWPAGTEIRIVGVLDSRVTLGATAAALEGTTAVIDLEEEFRADLSKALHESAQIFTGSALTVTHQILAGQPGAVLVAEAEKWAADCIFVGAKGQSALERITLGSVSSAVASHARCSVEVVRAHMEH